MSVSILLLIGVTFIFAMILNRKNFFKLGKNNRFAEALNKFNWFRNPWLSGFTIFGLNALYFGLTAFMLYLLTKFMIPFVHVIIMLLAVLLSIVTWISIGSNWLGSRMDRYKMGFVASSFYMILSSFFIYKWVTLEPAFPGDDTVMAAVGLIFGMIVTVVASITCFCFITYAPSRT